MEHAQELGLQIESHLRDFIEEQRAAVGALEGAFDPLDRPGKGAFLVAEQGRFDQPLGEGGAVQLDERLVATLALVVNGAGEEFLAGARLALEQHGGPSRGRHGDGLEDPTDGR